MTTELSQFDFEEMSTDKMFEALEQMPDAPEGEVETSPASAGGQGEQGEQPAKIEQKPTEQPAPKESEGTTEPVIKAADGKAELPYAVLKGERERRHAAEQEVERLTRQLAEFQERQNAGGDGEAAEIDEITTALDAMRDDYPNLATPIEKLTKLVQVVKQEVSEVRGAVRADKEAQHRAAAMTVQEQVDAAIDATPDLVLWRQSNPDVFNIAVDIDTALRVHPKWGKATYAERFAEVARQTAEMIPNAPRAKVAAQATTTTIAPKTPPKDTGDSPVRTLTDIPGGALPSADPLENLLRQDAGTLQRSFEDMPTDKLMEILARSA